MENYVKYIKNILCGIVQGLKNYWIIIICKIKERKCRFLSFLYKYMKKDYYLYIESKSDPDILSKVLKKYIYFELPENNKKFFISSNIIDIDNKYYFKNIRPRNIKSIKISLEFHKENFYISSFERNYTSYNLHIYKNNLGIKNFTMHQFKKQLRNVSFIDSVISFRDHWIYNPFA